MSNNKEYFLMHKNIRVCLLEISDEGIIGKIRKNQSEEEHLPLGCRMNDIKFHEWWRDRAIPKTRNGAKTALQKLGYSSTNSALVNNLALSLSDCYWICPRDEDLSWEEVNLFTNDFVDTFGEITLNQNLIIDLRKKTKFDCATSQGELQKKWCVGEDGRRYMIKGNFGQSFQQSLNEIFATKLHKEQGYEKFTPYTLVKLSMDDNTEGLGCFCYNFCNENVESISAWELLQTVKIRQNESLYFPLKTVCMNLGMSQEEFTSFIDYQIMTDYLITNTDRHMNNIAIMRNPDTLEILGFAPIFDSGNSMFYNTPYESLKSIHFNQIKTFSFIQKEVNLLKYVHDKTLVNIDKISDDFSIYENEITERQIRIPLIKELFNRKIDVLEAFQHGKKPWKAIY